MGGNVVCLWDSQNETSSTVLNFLEPVQQVLGTTIQKRVTVIKAGKDKGRDESCSSFCGQEMADGTDTAKLHISSTYNVKNVGFHGQMAV